MGLPTAQLGEKYRRAAEVPHQRMRFLRADKSFHSLTLRDLEGQHDTPSQGS